MGYIYIQIHMLVITIGSAIPWGSILCKNAILIIKAPTERIAIQVFRGPLEHQCERHGT